MEANRAEHLDSHREPSLVRDGYGDRLLLWASMDDWWRCLVKGLVYTNCLRVAGTFAGLALQTRDVGPDRDFGRGVVPELELLSKSVGSTRHIAISSTNLFRCVTF